MGRGLADLHLDAAVTLLACLPNSCVAVSVMVTMFTGLCCGYACPVSFVTGQSCSKSTLILLILAGSVMVDEIPH